MPVLIEVMTNDLVERHVSRGCQDGVDNHSPACVIIDCSASQSRKQELDMDVAWLEKTLEEIDDRDHVFLCYHNRRDPNSNGDEPPIQSKPKPAFIRQAFRRIIASHWRTYVSKLKGVQTFGPRRRQMPMDVFWTFLVSLSVCLFLTSLEHFVVSPTRFVFMIPSFAVIAALIFDNFTAPLAQPRNVICGNLIGAVVACTIVQLFGVEYRWLLTPLAVSIVGALQMLTGTIHPPGGSIALYVLYGPQKVRDLGFLYMLMPILVGAVFFVVAATAVLNVFSRRYYPKYWW